MTELKDSRKPIETKRFDRVQAAIWRQEAGGGNTNDPFYTFTVSRSFKDSNGAWHRAYSFTSRDLPNLELAVKWAMRELLLKAD